MPPGSPNLFRHELGSNLNKVFPPPQGGFEIPQVLSGVVSLTHDFPGTEPFRGLSILDQIGAADVLVLTQTLTVPAGYIWIVDEMSIHTTDTTSRDLRVTIRYSTPLGVIIVTVFRANSTATNPLPIPIGRRLFLPPNAFLELTALALTAGASLRFTLSYHQVPAGQFVPKN